MDNIVNINFLLLVLIIFLLFKHRKKLYLSKFDTLKEDYSNILDINFLDPYKNINYKNLYSVEHNKNEIVPTLFSSFKYSLEYKLAFELSHIFKVKTQETPGLNYNLKNIIDNHHQNHLFLCSETDFYETYLTQNKYINKLKYSFVCAFYRVHFLMFSRLEINISSWSDLQVYLNSDEADQNKIRIGIPNDNSNSYNDAKKLFSLLNIDIKTSHPNIKFTTTENEKDLFGYLKFGFKNPNAIDLLYLTTSSKHPYLNEYLEYFNVNLFSIDGLDKDSLDMLYYNNHSFDDKIAKEIFTNVNIKKNIYTNKITNSFKLNNNEKEKKIIGSEFLKTKSSRIILVAHNNLNKDYIKYFLRNIYGSLDKLKYQLDNYLLVPERQNFLMNLLDPYESSYCNKNIKYHPGAYDFYKEIQLITSDLTDSPFIEKNKFFN